MTVINCAFSCDNNYVQHAGVALLSILESNTNIEEINFYFICNNISSKNQENLKLLIQPFLSFGKRNIIFIDIYELTKGLNVDTGFNLSTYAKLFLGRLKNIDRILCFDSDIVCTGSLAELTTIDMGDKSVLGVQDTVNPYFVKSIGKDKNYRYINCGGVIVIDLAKWRKEKLEEQFISYVRQCHGNPPFVDQGVINKLCKTGVLPPNFNVINPMFMFSVKQIKKIYKISAYYSQKEIDYAKERPVIIHFTGELYNRPWSDDCSHPFKQIYLSLLDKTPWKGNVFHKKLSFNCKIENFVYLHCPFFVYLLMVRFVEIRHYLSKRNMKGG
jgi:lipopolysaccharide biosynthesis glycosyltransferase